MKKQTNRRHALVQAAAKLFYKNGYERSTVRELAQDVGIQSGSLFHHFETKEDILFAVMEEVILRITGRLWMASQKPEDPKEKIRLLIKTELQAILGDAHDAMYVMVYEWGSLSPQKSKEILKLRNVYESIWRDALNAGKDAGLIQHDTFVLRRFLTGAMSWTIFWYEPGGKMDLDTLVEQALLLIMKV
ncbi:MAG: TetR family transcriptional regulator [SAR324 cluster bacterium]|nr:TetR family transcriptional regulator [SAR324 cluster bacterium]